MVDGSNNGSRSNPFQNSSLASQISGQNSAHAQSFQDLYNQYVASPTASSQVTSQANSSQVQNSAYGSTYGFSQTQNPVNSQVPTPSYSEIQSQANAQSQPQPQSPQIPASVTSNANNANANGEEFKTDKTASSNSNDPSSSQKPQSSSLSNKDSKAKTKSANTQNHTFGIIFVSSLLSILVTFGLVLVASNFGMLQLPGETAGMTSVSKLEEERAKAALTLDKDAAPDWEKIFATVVPSSVSIEVALSGSQGSSLGSGFVIDKSGLVVTNNHVVSGGEDGQIVVTLYGNRVFEAKIKGTDPTADLAVLQIQNPPEDLQPVQFADSDGLIVGQSVLAVGNPLGLFDTATQGIVSALDRPVVATDKSAASQLVVTNAIQIDAAINPGNSGGALYDITGKLIGVPSSIAQVGSSLSSSSGSIGLGFAIPSNLVQSITKQIIDSGAAKHAALGVTIQDTTTVVDGVHRRAPRIETVSEDSPASKAGLQKDDCILSVDGKTTTSTYALMGFIRAKELNSTVKVTFVRDGKQQEVSVKLDKEQQLTPAPDDSSQMIDPFSPQK